MRLLVFCEAAADFRTASALVDRVLHDEGPAWVADILPSHPESIREWVSDGQGNEHFDIHHLDEYRRQLKDVRFAYGHFDGKPGAAGAQMARNAFFIARAIAKRDTSAGLGAVLLLWDMDDRGEERRRGLAQARAEASRREKFQIVLGCPDPMREAWVLAGFEPESDEERARLGELRELTGGEAEREARCSTEAPLARLRQRGEQSGLRAFLDEVRDLLVPL